MLLMYFLKIFGYSNANKKAFGAIVVSSTDKVGLWLTLVICYLCVLKVTLKHFRIILN